MQIFMHRPLWRSGGQNRNAMEHWVRTRVACDVQCVSLMRINQVCDCLCQFIPLFAWTVHKKNALFVKWYYYRSFFISAQPLRHSLSLAHSIHDKIHVGTLCTCVIKLWRSCRCRKFNKDFNGCVCVCVCRRLRCFFPSFLKYFLCNLTLICAYLKASNKTS